MPRSVNSVASRERKKNVLKHAKGFFGRRKKLHEQITYYLPLGNPGLRYPVIVEFVIKIMK